MADNRSRVCATCGAEDMELLQCSKCKQRYYCSVECQRVDWRSHKRSCHRLDTQRTPEQSRPRRCPYRPDTVSNSTGVCPFRDLVEESQLQEIIDKDLANGVNGMNELAGLARSPEMSMQIPLQKTVGKILRLLEKADLEVSNAYLNAAGTFISNMLQWEHNEFIKQDKYDRLASVAITKISQRGADCAFIFGKILFWLHGYDRIKFEAYFRNFSGCDTASVVAFISQAQIHEDWQSGQRSTLWLAFISKLLTIAEVP